MEFTEEETKIIENKIDVVNMLGCHDGIPMRDVRGLLPDDRVDEMIERLVMRGGHKKIVHGVKDEIWLENTEGPYKIIRINSNNILSYILNTF